MSLFQTPFLLSPTLVPSLVPGLLYQPKRTPTNDEVVKETPPPIDEGPLRALVQTLEAELTAIKSTSAAEVAREKEKTRQAESKLAANQVVLQEVQEAEEKCKEDVAERTTDIAELQRAVQECQDEKEAAQADCDRVQEKLGQSNSALDQAQSQLVTIAITLDTNTTRLTTLDRENYVAREGEAKALGEKIHAQTQKLKASINELDPTMFTQVLAATDNSTLKAREEALIKQASDSATTSAFVEVGKAIKDVFGEDTGITLDAVKGALTTVKIKKDAKIIGLEARIAAHAAVPGVDPCATLYTSIWTKMGNTGEAPEGDKVLEALVHLAEAHNALLEEKTNFLTQMDELSEKKDDLTLRNTELSSQVESMDVQISTLTATLSECETKKGDEQRRFLEEAQLFRKDVCTALHLPPPETTLTHQQLVEAVIPGAISKFRASTKDALISLATVLKAYNHDWDNEDIQTILVKPEFADMDRSKLYGDLKGLVTCAGSPPPIADIRQSVVEEVLALANALKINQSPESVQEVLLNPTFATMTTEVQDQVIERLQQLLVPCPTTTPPSAPAVDDPRMGEMLERFKAHFHFTSLADAHAYFSRVEGDDKREQRLLSLEEDLLKNLEEGIQAATLPDVKTFDFPTPPGLPTLSDLDTYEKAERQLRDFARYPKSFADSLLLRRDRLSIAAWKQVLRTMNWNTIKTPSIWSVLFDGRANETYKDKAQDLYKAISFGIVGITIDRIDVPTGLGYYPSSPAPWGRW